MFLNTLTADDKYSRDYMEKFAQPIEIQLSKRQNVFFLIF